VGTDSLLQGAHRTECRRELAHIAEAGDKGRLEQAGKSTLYEEDTLTIIEKVSL
jgi:hypothetical protein